MITIADCITELNRERNMRSHVYPKLMHRGKLTLREIDRRNGRLGKAIEFLEELQVIKHGQQTDLFTKTDDSHESSNDGQG